MSHNLLSGEKPVFAARSKRFIARRTDSRNAGAAIGYLPFSRVNDSPSTINVRRPESFATPILGASDLYFESIKRSKTSLGSIMCVSVSTILKPFFIFPLRESVENFSRYELLDRSVPMAQARAAIAHARADETVVSVLLKR